MNKMTMTEDDRRVYRQVMMDPKRHRFQNKAAVYLTVASLVLMMSLSVLFGEYYQHKNQATASSTSTYDDSSHRWLEEDDNDDQTDYSQYSCRYIYDKTPDAGDAQCQFARTCNGGEGIWAEFVFCSKNYSTPTLFWILSPIMLVWMITLFRLLGSTAEDYFSPALEMFSVKLGLPPRFAGVSLLALGNGAADVSATMSAIINDHENGYKLSLGALTGAAMIVGGVVAGVVVLVAGGVPCRGALVRDVLALIVTVIVVWTHLASGTIGPSSITLFLSMYALFVSTVLVADIYHRAVVLPRLARAADSAELQRQISEEGHVIQEAGELSVAHLTQAPSDATSAPSALSSIISALSNYDSNDHNQTNNNESGAGWGIDSDQLEQDRPIVLHGTHGILHRDNQTIHPDAPADPDGSGEYALVEDHIDRVCVSEGSPGFGAHNWSGAWNDGKQDLMRHAAEVWQDVAHNEDLNMAEKFLLFIEFPFTIARKATVPIPCEGYYNRGVVALATALSPLWLSYYLYQGHNINVYQGAAILYFGIVWLVALFCAALVLRFAPGGEGNMALLVATPLALYGFVIAATWIDFVADHLVYLLDFMGIVLHIPGQIMGLTVLAWGNSMGDLSANMTMARKGLANMAMTACFAGPVFNILIGLGFGFSSAAAYTGNPVANVSLSPSVVVGFVFVILNGLSILLTGSILGKGRIEMYYGYMAVGLYAVYLTTSIGLQFSKYGDS